MFDALPAEEEAVVAVGRPRRTGAASASTSCCTAAEAAAPSSRRHGDGGRKAPAVAGRRGRVPGPRLCSGSGALPACSFKVPAFTVVPPV